ncbi:hypothetical protein LZU85_15895, partial [Vibrio sp. IRLE0018]|uniref:hypothetical protein n=1 Tax=Vibrio floridensis TaxID=2908007 RepID=UPI001F3929DB
MTLKQKCSLFENVSLSKMTKPNPKTGFLNVLLTVGVAINNGQTFCGTRWSQTKIIQQKQKNLSISAEVWNKWRSGRDSNPRPP